jgi:hypothetical protein
MTFFILKKQQQRNLVLLKFIINSIRLQIKSLNSLLLGENKTKLTPNTLFFIPYVFDILVILISAEPPASK